MRRKIVHDGAEQLTYEIREISLPIRITATSIRRIFRARSPPSEAQTEGSRVSARGARRDSEASLRGTTSPRGRPLRPTPASKLLSPFVTIRPWSCGRALGSPCPLWEPARVSPWRPERSPFRGPCTPAETSPSSRLGPGSASSPGEPPSASTSPVRAGSG